jgi:hypothetical protein
MLVDAEDLVFENNGEDGQRGNVISSQIIETLDSIFLIENINFGAEF